MLRVGENLNVMIKKIGAAMKERDPKPIQELAIAEAKAGVDFIDINLGPARKGGGELMEWIVKVVQEVVDTLARTPVVTFRLDQKRKDGGHAPSIVLRRRPFALG